MGYPVVVTEPTGEGIETIVESISNIDTDGIITALEGIKDSLDAMSGTNKFAALVDGSITEITAADLEGVTNLKSGAFSNTTSLVSVEIPDTVKSWGSSIFANCSNLESVTIDGPFTPLAGYVFQNCLKLENVVLPAGQTTIPTHFFDNCPAVKTVYLPSTITSIGAGAMGTGANNMIINCGFAEGAVSGAPWGAYGNYTINYNVPQP